MIQKWLVFPNDATDTYIKWHLARAVVCGYIKGIPPSLQSSASEEGWTLPHIYEEILPDIYEEILPAVEEP